MTDQTTAAPPRTHEQRMEALARANEIRSRRAQLKKSMQAGRKKPAVLLVDPPEWLGTMKVYELLMATPKLGRVKVGRILNACAVSPSKTVGGLSRRQREALIGYLRSGDNMPAKVMSAPRFAAERSELEVALA
jgi:S13-like protein